MRDLKKEEIGRGGERLFEREACLISWPRGYSVGACSKKYGISIGI